MEAFFPTYKNKGNGGILLDLQLVIDINHMELRLFVLGFILLFCMFLYEHNWDGIL